MKKTLLYIGETTGLITLAHEAASGHHKNVARLLEHTAYTAEEKGEALVVAVPYFGHGKRPLGAQYSPYDPNKPDLEARARVVKALLNDKHGEPVTAKYLDEALARIEFHEYSEYSGTTWPMKAMVSMLLKYDRGGQKVSTTARDEKFQAIAPDGKIPYKWLHHKNITPFYDDKNREPLPTALVDRALPSYEHFNIAPILATNVSAEAVNKRFVDIGVTNNDPHSMATVLDAFFHNEKISTMITSESKLRVITYYFQLQRTLPCIPYLSPALMKSLTAEDKARLGSEMPDKKLILAALCNDTAMVTPAEAAAATQTVRNLSFESAMNNGHEAMAQMVITAGVPAHIIQKAIKNAVHNDRHQLLPFLHQHTPDAVYSAAFEQIINADGGGFMRPLSLEHVPENRRPGMALVLQKTLRSLDFAAQQMDYTHQYINDPDPAITVARHASYPHEPKTLLYMAAVTFPNDAGVIVNRLNNHLQDVKNHLSMAPLTKENARQMGAFQKVLTHPASIRLIATVKAFHQSGYGMAAIVKDGAVIRNAQLVLRLSKKLNKITKIDGIQNTIIAFLTGSTMKETTHIVPDMLAVNQMAMSMPVKRSWLAKAPDQSGPSLWVDITHRKAAAIKVTAQQINDLLDIKNGDGQRIATIASVTQGPDGITLEMNAGSSALIAAQELARRAFKRTPNAAMAAGLTASEADADTPAHVIIPTRFKPGLVKAVAALIR